MVEDNELIEFDDNNDLLSLDDESDYDDDNYTSDTDEAETKFTIKQKILAWIIGVVSLIVFIIILFPYEEVTRYFVAKYTVPKNILVDFQSLHFSFIGSKKLDLLMVQTPEGITFKAEELEIKPSLIQLIQKKLKGDIIGRSIEIETDNYEFKVNNLNIKNDLTQITEGLMKMNGNVMINLVGGKIINTPEYPMVGTLAKTKIRSILINLALRNGTLEIQKLKLRSDKIEIDLKGLIKLNQNMDYSQLNLELCPKFTKKYANERPDLADTLQMFKNMKKSSCFKVKGTIAKPRVDTPKLTPPSMNTPAEVRDG